MGLNYIIIEQDGDAVSDLKQLIKQNTSWRGKAIFSDGWEALDYLKNEPVDLIFLDLGLPGSEGMKIAAMIPQVTKIIFTSHDDEQAIESYNYSGIDYLLKPFKMKRFLTMVQKVESFFAGINANNTCRNKPEQNFVFMKSGKTFIKVYLDEILYFEAKSEYVLVVTNNQKFLVYKRLKEIQNLLLHPFIRVHNSFIINSNWLIKIQDNHIYVADKHIPISVKFRKEILDFVQQRTF